MITDGLFLLFCYFSSEDELPAPTAHEEKVKKEMSERSREMV